MWTMTALDYDSYEGTDMVFKNTEGDRVVLSRFPQVCPGTQPSKFDLETGNAERGCAPRLPDLPSTNRKLRLALADGSHETPTPCRPREAPAPTAHLRYHLDLANEITDHPRA